MKTNVGGWDRNLRLIVGSGAVVAGIFAPWRLPLRLGMLALGVSALFTGGARYCPLNDLLGANTAGEGIGPEILSAGHSLVE